MPSRWIAPVPDVLKEPLPDRDAAIMCGSGPVGFQWTEDTDNRCDTCRDVGAAYCDNCATAVRPSIARETIALDALAGPSETMEAAGLTNRGSLAWAMKERGFPRPVKTLRGIRLWDLTAVTAWKDRSHA